MRRSVGAYPPFLFDTENEGAQDERNPAAVLRSTNAATFHGEMKCINRFALSTGRVGRPPIPDIPARLDVGWAAVGRGLTCLWQEFLRYDPQKGPRSGPKPADRFRSFAGHVPCSCNAVLAFSPESQSGRGKNHGNSRCACGSAE